MFIVYSDLKTDFQPTFESIKCRKVGYEQNANLCTLKLCYYFISSDSSSIINLI